MQKLGLILILLLFMVKCSYPIVKPVYIEPEADLTKDIDKLYCKVEKKPSGQDLKMLLNSYHIYYLRIGKKIEYNNKEALK